MSYCYEWRVNRFVFHFFCDECDMNEMLLSIGETRDSLTPAKLSQHWTMWKDAMIHTILNIYDFEDAFIKMIVHDKVYHSETSFDIRPARHYAFFCNCFIMNFLSNYWYEPIPEAFECAQITSADLYCHETM